MMMACVKNVFAIYTAATTQFCGAVKRKNNNIYNKNKKKYIKSYTRAQRREEIG